MIMSRLFTALTTRAWRSSPLQPPAARLYKDGLNRELFVPFIELIEARMEVVPLNGPTDCS
jgi:cell division protein ZapE